ncbi:MAG: polysaccharide pyruvyl transferase family protein [Candidatus Cryptobacteroides sp.]
MKIAILTLQLHTNYGGILQAYALQTVLERMGHEVEHLQPEVTYPPLHPAWQMPLVWGKRLIRKFLGGDRKLPIFEHPYKWVRKNTDQFIADNIHCRYVKPADWDESLADDYDVFVVGSDQVWRPYMSGHIERYLTAFLGASDVQRIAFSASFGVDNDEYSEDERNQARDFLPLFNAISVREESGIKLCRDIFGVDVVQTLDPTMLLSADDYDRLSVNATSPSGKLMTYILDESSLTDRVVDVIANKSGLKPFRANSRVELGEKEPKLSNRQQLPVENWLRSFRDAELVITDSFHACVFSILYNKPFLCIGNDFRGAARFHSLLGQFGLMDRLISIDSGNMPSSDIDWTNVNAILEEKRKESLDFLHSALGD